MKYDFFFYFYWSWEKENKQLNVLDNKNNLQLAIVDFLCEMQWNENITITWLQTEK